MIAVVTASVVLIETQHVWQIPGVNWFWPLLGMLGCWVFSETYFKILSICARWRTRLPRGMKTVKDLCRAVLAANYEEICQGTERTLNRQSLRPGSSSSKSWPTRLRWTATRLHSAAVWCATGNGLSETFCAGWPGHGRRVRVASATPMRRGDLAGPPANSYSDWARSGYGRMASLPKVASVSIASAKGSR